MPTIMPHTPLGQSGLVVSRLAFGTMTFTAGNADMPSVYKTGTAAAEAMIGRALDAGITLFDTADGYAGGESETMLCRALGAHRDRVAIATKVGFRNGPALDRQGLSRRHILRSIDESLTRLGTDRVELYIAHREDPHTPLEEALDALDAVVRAGKALYLGVSNWQPWKIAAALEIQRARGLAPFTHAQMHYSLLGRDVERDFLPMAARYGLGLTVWGPLSGGFLTGKYDQGRLDRADGRLSGFDLLPFDKARGFALLDVMRPIAAAHGASLAQLAIAWLLARPGVSSVILGASRMDQLDDTIAAAGLRLSANEIAALDTATALAPVYPHWFIQGLADAPMAAALAG